MTWLLSQLCGIPRTGIYLAPANIGSLQAEAYKLCVKATLPDSLAHAFMVFSIQTMLRRSEFDARTD